MHEHYIKRPLMVWLNTLNVYIIMRIGVFVRASATITWAFQFLRKTHVIFAEALTKW